MDNAGKFSSEYIEFREVRDVGRIVGDTFGFVRQEYKLLFKSIARKAGPWLLAALVMVVLGGGLGPGGWNSGEPVTMFDSTSGEYREYYTDGNSSLFAMLFFPGVICGVVGLYYLVATTINYCGVYVRLGAGNFDESDVRQAVKKDGGRTFVGGLVNSVVTSLASNCLLVPGLYLTVPMNLMMIVYILERDTTLSGAFSEGFALSKNRWWVSFISSSIVGLIPFVVFFLLFIVPLLNPEPPGAAEPLSIVSVLLGVFYLVVLAVAGTGMYAMIHICGVFIYYANREYHFGDSIAEEIENIDRFDNDDEIPSQPIYRPQEDKEPAEDDPQRWSRAPRNGGSENNFNNDFGDDSADDGKRDDPSREAS